MARVQLTDRFLRGLGTTQERAEYTDAMMPAFGVRVGARSTTFFVRYQGRGTSRGRREILGHYPLLSLADARIAARERLSWVDRGRDPALEAQNVPASSTLEAVAEAYLADLQAGFKRDGSHRSWKQYDHLLRREVLPRLGGTEIREVSRSLVRSLLLDIVPRAPVVANRVQAVLSALLSWALDRGEYGLTTHPLWRLRKLHDEKPSSRALAWDEIRRLWRSLDRDPSASARALQIALLTGARRSEVLGLPRQGEICADGWWTVSAHRVGRKNGLPHRIHLTDEAQRVLARCPENDDWYFPSRQDTTQHLRGMRKATRRHQRLAGVDAWSPHVLRATMATRLSELGFEDHVIGALAGHKPRGITARVYIRTLHRMDRAKRRASMAWSCAIGAVAASEAAASELSLVATEAVEEFLEASS